MGVLGTTNAQSALARQGTDYAKVYSLDRDNQLRAVLGSGFEGLLGSGILAGGRLADNGGLSVKLPSGTVLMQGGVVYTLTSDAVYNGCSNGATNTVWVKIARTQGSQAARANLDTWALAFDKTTDGSVPDATGWINLGGPVTSGGAITSINDPPGSSYVAVSAPLRRRGYLSKSVAGSTDVTATPDEALQPFHHLTGALTGAHAWILPHWAGEEWTIDNSTSGAFALTVKGKTGTGIVVGSGKTAKVASNGTNFVRVTADV